ncbi:thermonuclease family protein [candidate division WWE3 bacterium]|uniref:Thermonuclease family protein n=1 Tax=candidate division WWE3 bacterium TaxID=2053526 RepID=A0A955LGG1_UNCKA|nr:thermonuclease family protein [candidate division WWE3 bacterium]
MTSRKNIFPFSDEKKFISLAFSFGILALLTALLTLTSPVENNPTATAPDNGTFFVTRIIDGDTIEVNGKYKVRYIGIDAPEMSSPIECYAEAATQENSRLVLGKQIEMQKDVSETDRYGRLLRYVYVDGISINESLVKNGFALATPYPPDVSQQAMLSALEEEAQIHERGLWGSCDLEAKVEGVQDVGECSIKGNISINGEKVYHLPGQRYYTQTQIDESAGEKYFCTEEEAQQSGWRKSKI